MTVFGAYSEYYDLLYADKDYAGEAAYVKGFLDKHGDGKVKRILDLGCGTARHDTALAALGYEVTGVDRSPDMLVMARERFTGKLVEGDVRTVRIGGKFDAVTTLFHVMSYQATDEDVLATMRTAREHLHDGGLFLFDFWYGPAVLAQRPERRVKELKNEKIKVARHCEPVLHEDRHIVDVHYDIKITTHDSPVFADASTGKRLTTHETNIKETHSMRYFFRPELEYFLSASGFDTLQCVVWMREKEPTAKDWGAMMVARRT